MAASQTGSEKFSSVLARAEKDLWTSFEEAREFVHRGDIGNVREDAVARFLRRRLPKRFAVASGEVLDTAGSHSTQTDILIYDASLTVPLLESSQGTILLPSEALLATVEVKSTLTKSEAGKAVGGIKSLHTLRPWDAPFGVLAGSRGSRTDPELPRIMTSIFAYQSDLKSDGWAGAELTRIREACVDVALPVPCLDRLLVLDRGLINPATGKALLTEQWGIVGDWFFNLVNFLTREAARRRPFPWKDYHYTHGRAWTTAGSEQYDAPLATRATATERLKARKKRNSKA